LVENVTAPSAGGFPGPDGEVRLRMRLPFRTGSSEYLDVGCPGSACMADPDFRSAAPPQVRWSCSRHSDRLLRRPMDNGG
ncbi:MAG: hypothetical protein PHC78_08625, partial [Verrucomicrobiota bacterium]|nr:hypothetical protein [Verrucomicrobiota bacterium]